MEKLSSKENARGRFMSTRPRAVTLSAREQVKTSQLAAGEPLPLVLQPSDDNVDLFGWVKSNQELLMTKLREHGGLLFRGFEVGSIEDFNRLVTTFSEDLMDYLDQHTPRTRLSETVYTSTEYPADHRVPFHSENSKNHVWPMKIWFCCQRAAEQGGETPIADNRKVFQLIPATIREKFMEKGVMYVRNFGEGVGLGWQRAFQTSDRAEVEDYFRRARVDFEWKDGDRLRVRHVCPAYAVHPVTRELVWFNQAHLFHVSSVEPEARESLLAMFREEDLPSNALYGDGSPIETSALDEIRAAFREAAVYFPWRERDVLMLDNMLVAHGRAPFTGQRRILVSMAEPWGHDRQATEELQ